MMHERSQETIQIIPATGWVEVTWLGDDNVYTSPLVAWALQRSWACPRDLCGGWTLCADVDRHNDDATSVVPLALSDTYVDEVDPASIVRPADVIHDDGIVEAAREQCEYAEDSRKRRAAWRTKEGS